jgi:tetratricopeptide (TPR) repeat protein
VTAARVPLGGFEPLAVSFLWMRAEELREAGELPEAVANYRLVTELSPRVGPAWALPAHLLLWTQSEAEDPDAEWRWVKEAIALLERGLSLDPDDPELLAGLGLAYYARLSLTDDLRPKALAELSRMPEELAVETFRRLVEVRPDRAAEAYLTDSLRLLAERHDENGDTAAALARYRELLPRLEAASGRSAWAREQAERIRRRIGELEGR